MKRMILPSAVTRAALLLGSAMSLAAQTPVPAPISKGVPREIPLSRTDNELTSLVAAGVRNYKTYSFRYGDRIDRATIRQWRGLLVFPRASELGNVVNGWYTHSDGTVSQLVMNDAGRAIGVLSLRGTRIWASLDLNGDGLVDFFRSISRNGDEMIAVMEGDGAAFFRRWRDGQNPLCAVTNTKSVGKSDSRTGIVATVLMKPGTMPMCGETGRDSGPLAGIRRDGPSRSPDPMDRMCAGVGPSPVLAGGGPRTDAASGAAVGGLAGAPTDGSTGVEVGSVAGMPTDEENRQRMADKASRVVAEAVRERVYLMLLKPQAVEGNQPATSDRESPVPDSEGGRVGAGSQSITEMCSARARADRRWKVIEITEKQSGGVFTDTNCDDPISDPASADATNRVPKCGPARSAESVSSQLLSGIGAYESRRCSRYENPGPDGTCRGGRTLTGNRGQLWYGFGSLIGLVPCDGIACDPKTESR